MGLSIVYGWAAKFNRPNECERAEVHQSAHMDKHTEDKRKVATSEDPGISFFTVSASGQQSSLCCVEKTGPQAYKPDRVLASIPLLNVNVRALDRPLLEWCNEQLICLQFKTLPSYFILISYYNTPLYVHSIEKVAKCFGYFSHLIFSSLRSAERVLSFSLHR